MNDKKGMLVLNLQTKNQNTMTELKETITTVLNKIDGVNKSKKEIFTDTLNLFLSSVVGLIFYNFLGILIQMFKYSFGIYFSVCLLG